ncbi:unnamed protein product [Trichogramma brassicae]|uniref:Small ribosomal subunit protein uS17 n=1 Tax=Trichogramma brassicae TaxID=86971 RepID=A0A6H5IZC4_9HYME|nr:unnamed protein product [Trichogramma brassicae]
MKTLIVYGIKGKTSAIERLLRANSNFKQNESRKKKKKKKRMTKKQQQLAQQQYTRGKRTRRKTSSRLALLSVQYTGLCCRCRARFVRKKAKSRFFLPFFSLLSGCNLHGLPIDYRRNMSPIDFVVLPKKLPITSNSHQKHRAKSFLKQPTVFLNKKKGTSKGRSKSLRYTREVGLGFKTPREAIEGTYIDKKCPFTGDVSIRGRILTGTVIKNKMQRTIVVRRDYLHYIRKYNRFEKRHRNMSVHLSPAFRDVEIGDVVTIGECRPLSKTVRFNVLKVSKGSGTKKSFKKF